MMPKLTDLFCHTVLFAKFNMLTSFNSHFLANIERAYTPHNFSVELVHSVSPIKYEETFFLKTFMVDRGQFFFWGGGANLLGAVIHVELMIRSCKG